MPLILKEDQVCPYAENCPYSGAASEFCNGASLFRKNQFICEFADENGIIEENQFRSKFDLTGKMQVVLEKK